MRKKLVYICSHCRGDYEKNIDNAVIYSGIAFEGGCIPITPHLYFSRVLNNDEPEQRAIGMEAGKQLLLMCSEVWVFGLDKPSEGMQAEIALAIRNGIPVKDGEQMAAQRHQKKDGVLDARNYAFVAMVRKGRRK